MSTEDLEIMINEVTDGGVSGGGEVDEATFMLIVGNTAWF